MIKYIALTICYLSAGIFYSQIKWALFNKQYLNLYKKLFNDFFIGCGMNPNQFNTMPEDKKYSFINYMNSNHYFYSKFRLNYFNFQQIHYSDYSNLFIWWIIFWIISLPLTIIIALFKSLFKVVTESYSIALFKSLFKVVTESYSTATSNIFSHYIEFKKNDKDTNI